MQATIIYAASLPTTTTKVSIGGKESKCSVACAIKTVGEFYDDPGLYEVVAVVDTPADTEADCEALFERFNVGDRAGLRIRSFSVGDVVAFESGRTFVCRGCGFKEVAPAPSFLASVPRAA